MCVEHAFHIPQKVPEGSEHVSVEEDVTSTTDECSEPRQIHSFYFIRYHTYDDPKIKAKLDEAGKEIEKCNLARIQIISTMKAKRVERSNLLAWFDYLMFDCNEFGSNTEKIDGIVGQLRTIKLEMESLEAELRSLMEKREKAFERIKLLRKKRDQGNYKFFRSRELLDKARRTAASRNIEDLKDLSSAEVEGFMSLWNSNKKFRAAYERRVSASLVARQLSQDRVRKPEDETLAEPAASALSQTEVIRMEDITQQSCSYTVSQVLKKQAEIESDEGLVSDASQLEGPGIDDEDIDEGKLKEMRREEEAEKARQAMDRKRKVQERAAAKAAIRAHIEAQKKLKEIEKNKTKTMRAVNVSSSSDTKTPDASQVDKEKAEALDPVKQKTRKKPVVPRERSFRHKNRGRRTSSHPNSVKRKQLADFLVSAAAAAAVVVIVFLQVAYWNLKLKTDSNAYLP